MDSLQLHLGPAGRPTFPPIDERRASLLGARRPPLPAASCLVVRYDADGRWTHLIAVRRAPARRRPSSDR
jgi:hypothetical protein